jgi:hypothetical protein
LSSASTGGGILYWSVGTPPPHISYWPGYKRLSDLIRNYKIFTAFNSASPPSSLVNGKIIAIMGKRVNPAHRNKIEINFKHSSFKPVCEDWSNQGIFG